MEWSRCYYCLALFWFVCLCLFLFVLTKSLFSLKSSVFLFNVGSVFVSHFCCWFLLSVFVVVVFKMMFCCFCLLSCFVLKQKTIFFNFCILFLVWFVFFIGVLLFLFSGGSIKKNISPKIGKKKKHEIAGRLTFYKSN